MKANSSLRLRNAMRPAALLALLPLLAVSRVDAQPGGGAGGPPAATPVIVAEARLEPVAERIEALGTLRANESVGITSNVTETISVVHFDDGQRVSEGAMLVEMTSAEEHALLEEAQARVAEAQSQYDRVRSLVAQGSASESLLDERKRDLDTARAMLVALESRLADRVVKAPFDGVVGLRNISRGALVEPGDLITTLDDDSVMKLDFTVPSLYLAQLKPGLQIQARARPYGERAFDGVVRGIDTRIDPVTRSVQVRALLPNPARALRPGLLAAGRAAARPARGAGGAGGGAAATGDEPLRDAAGGRRRRTDGRNAARCRSVPVSRAWRRFATVSRSATRSSPRGRTRRGRASRCEVLAVDDGTSSLRDMVEAGQ